MRAQLNELAIEAHSTSPRNWLPSAPIRLTILWIASGAVTFAVMARHVASMFARFEETSDFATFFQATHLIGHHVWNPYSTISPYNAPHFGFPFIANHFELIAWLISPVLSLWSSGIALLVIAALSISIAQVVTAIWATEILKGNLHGVGSYTIFILAAEATIFANPWYLYSVFFDFHFETLTVPLLVAAGYLAYRHRYWTACIFAVLVALTGDVQSTYLAGLGLGLFFLSPHQYRKALWFVIIGSLFFLVALVGHFNDASNVLTRFGYLSGGQPTSIIGMLTGIATHPSLLLSTFVSRFTTAAKFFLPSSIGVFNPLGLLVATVVFAPQYLSAAPQAFLVSNAAFQNVAMQPFLAIGGTLSVAWVMDNVGYKVIRKLVLLTSVVALAAGFAVSSPIIRSAFKFNATVSQKTGQELATVLDRIPANAEVLAYMGIGGRFAGRRYYYPVINSAYLDLPIWEKTVYIVIVPDQGFEGMSIADSSRLETVLTSSPTFARYTRSVYYSPRVHVYVYRAPRVGVYANFGSPV